MSTDSTGVAPTEPIAAYEAGVADARRAFDGTEALRAVMDPGVSPELLEAFLIQFCALGVGMTEPVDGWIRRAGAACRAQGLEDLGAALERHAEHEAGHHEMMIADTRALVERWNDAGRRPKLRADELLGREPPPGVAAYRKLHEDTIAGPTPYGQVAIEYEIERLSVTHGAPLLEHCAARCGPELVACLSFVKDHVALDQGHTEFNRRQMDAHLARHPDHLQALVVAGGDALRTYAAFLGDCLGAAREVLARRE